VERYSWRAAALATAQAYVEARDRQSRRGAARC
jgi:hypothetical protein